MAKIERLFIAEYEQMRNWTTGKKAILNTLLDSDYYLIFKTRDSNQSLSSMYNNVLEQMGSHKEVIDVTGMSVTQYDDFILAKVNQLSDSDTYIFFLQMEEQYKRLKPQIKGIPTQHIYSKPTYKVGMRQTKSPSSPTPTQSTLADTANAPSSATNMAPPQKKSQRNQKKQIHRRDFEDTAEQVFSGMVDTLLEQPVQTPKQKSDATDKAGAFYEQYYDKTSSLKGTQSVENERHSTSKTTSQANTPLPHKPPKLPRMTLPQGNYNNAHQEKKNSTTAQSDGADNLMNIDDIEKRIFDSKINTGEFTRAYSDLDRKKAVLIQAVFDRTVNSICALLQINGENSQPHSMEDFVQFMTILLKSKDFSDFNDSLSSVDPGSDLKIQKSNTYTYLLDEVRYYAHLCTVLYSEDQWN